LKEGALRDMQIEIEGLKQGLTKEEFMAQVTKPKPMQKGKKWLASLIPLFLFARWAYTAYFKKQAGESIADEI